MDNTYDTGGYYAALFGALAVYFLIFAVVYVVQSILLAAMFKKAGIPAWKAWVPFVNMWTLFEMGGQKGWYIFFSFIPFLGGIAVLVFQIIALIEINRRFRQSGGMLALAILLSPVYFGIMGFGSAQWYGPVGGGLGQPQFAGAGAPYGAPVAAYGQPAAPYGAPATQAFPAQSAPAPYGDPYADSTPSFDSAPAAPLDNEGVSAVAENVAAGGLTAILVSDLTPYEGQNAQAKAGNAAEARPIITSIAGSFGSRTATSAPLLVVLDAAIAADPEVAKAKQYIDAYGAQVNARTLVLSDSATPPPAAPGAWG